VASRGITINTIAPGYIETDMTAQLNEKTRDDILNSIPLGRLGSPEDVAGVSLFLASSDADYITGQTITIDGGMAI
jgi:3-oxoacyl-[acyl-carrier protein] reductase